MSYGPWCCVCKLNVVILTQSQTEPVGLFWIYLLTMTLTVSHYKKEDLKMKVTTIGKAVKQVVVEAMEQDRVNFGIFQCVDILDRDTDSVMVCILPESKTQDISTRIQHTLIEAFCRENSVKVIKVDCATKISTIFTATATKEQKDRTLSTDFSCVLVMNPETQSHTDQFVCDYCENFMLGGVVPHGCVEVPV